VKKFSLLCPLQGVAKDWLVRPEGVVPGRHCTVLLALDTVLSRNIDWCSYSQDDHDALQFSWSVQFLLVPFISQGGEWWCNWLGFTDSTRKRGKPIFFVSTSTPTGTRVADPDPISFFDADTDPALLLLWFFVVKLWSTFTALPVALSSAFSDQLAPFLTVYHHYGTFTKSDKC
jgi:hypothetical protein